MNQTPDMTELPPEVAELVAMQRDQQTAMVEAVGKTVAKLRDEAIKGRRQSGIEKIWEEDYEHYEGIDDANRDSHPWVKSASASGGLTRQANKTATRCSSFFNITRQFVDSAAARMGDILLPAGDWNFAVKPSPVQDDVNPQSPVQGVVSPEPQTPAVGDPAQPVSPDGQPQAPVAPQMDPNAEDPRQVEAERRAEKGELWIQDKLVECSYHTEVRKVIEDAARIGTGILKGPFPQKMTSRKATQQGGGYSLEIVESVNPASKRIDPWDFYPDPACGDNVHDGNYVLERDRLTTRQLRDLASTPGYLKDQIEKVIDEGPSKCNYVDDRRDGNKQTNEADKFDVWYFYGLIDPDDFTAMHGMANKKPLAEGEQPEPPLKDCCKDLIPAIVTLVNDTPIKAFLNPLDTGEFPYDVMPWQTMQGQPWGCGVARQGRTPQEMLNAAARALMDNAGLASGPMIVLRQGAVLPADGQWTITPRKVWYATEQADVRSTADAFTVINIPMVQNELNAIIELAYKMMEDATGISFLLQGQQGSAPDTVGGMELLHRNASALLRRIARVFDERVTEPHVKRYYEWLLLHGPDDAKGDMKIQAIGSTALVEREIQSMDAMNLLQLSLNPAFGLDPEKAMVQVLTTKRFIPDKWTMDPQKRQQLPPPTIPAIEVAKIKAQVDQARLAQEKDIAVANNQLAVHKVDVDQSRENVYANTMAQEAQTNAQTRVAELQVKKEIAILQYATQQKVALDKVKADLAARAMTLKVQKDLSAADKAMPEVAQPAFEPPGKAAPGHAFTE